MKHLYLYMIPNRKHSIISGKINSEILGWQTTYPSRHFFLQRLINPSVYVLNIQSNWSTNFWTFNRSGNISQIFNTCMYLLSFSMSVVQTIYIPSTLNFFQIIEELLQLFSTFLLLGLHPLESLSRRNSNDIFTRNDFSFLNDFKKLSLKKT